MEKKQFIFVLGRYPEFSLEEIKAVFFMLSYPYKLIQHSKNIALIESRANIDIDTINKTLGGTVKIGEVIRIEKYPVLQEWIEEYIASNGFLSHILKEDKEKVQFGLSIYSCAAKEKEWNQIESQLSRYIYVIKTALETGGVKARFPNQTDSVLSSVSVEKNKLLTDGAEILFIVTQDGLIIGKTLAVQEFEAFSKRDFGRPMRDMDSGIMPPKIARMMLNLARVKKLAKILDPFCGSGTMLQEALYLGYTDVTGTDNSEKAITDTKTNLDWLFDHKRTIHAETRVELLDVGNLRTLFQINTFDAIVCEPYLGPNRQYPPQLAEIAPLQKELKLLYLRAWKAFAQVLKPGGVVVMILPVFHVKGKNIPMEILQDIEKLGYTQTVISQSPRKTLLVGNNHDFVLREIVRYEKSK